MTSVNLKKIAPKMTEIWSTKNGLFFTHNFGHFSTLIFSPLFNPTLQCHQLQAFYTFHNMKHSETHFENSKIGIIISDFTKMVKIFKPFLPKITYPVVQLSKNASNFFVNIICADTWSKKLKHTYKITLPNLKLKPCTKINYVIISHVLWAFQRYAKFFWTRNTFWVMTIFSYVSHPRMCYCCMYPGHRRVIFFKLI